MVKPNYPQFEIDDLTVAIRETIATRKHDDKSGVTAPEIVSSENKSQVAPVLRLQPDFQPRSNNRYHINDLLRYHDRAFAQNAYRAILKRPPDATELARALKSLRSGRLNKIDLLATLRYSAEGKAKKVELEGLSLPALVRRLGQLPVIGYAIRLVIGLVRLPNLIRNQREFEGYVLSQNQQIADFINLISSQLTECGHAISRVDETTSKQLGLLTGLTADLHAVRRRQETLEHTAAERLDELQQEVRADQTETREQAGKLRSLETQFASRMDTQEELLQAQIGAESAKRAEEIEQSISKQQQLIGSTAGALRAEIDRVHTQLQHARAELALQGRNILAAADRPPWQSQPADLRGPAETHHLDAFYAALEDRFRGTRDQIKERFRRYLPYVKALDNMPGPSLIDLGSGRGEWLELLNEAGIKSYGVEKNLVLIEQCRKRGLDVVEEDIIVHLRRKAAGSAGAVTGFHIIEHLSMDTLLTLLDEVMRVLRPGGAAIFETPNPENVLVGSNFFYLDPTHRHPLPSQLMQFLLESRGFHRIEVINLHPWDAGRVAGESELAERFNGYFFGPMDYAILGWKVGL